LALLACSLTFARDTLAADPTAEFDRGQGRDRNGTFAHEGRRTRFVIATDENHLRGRALIGYRALEDVPSRLIEMAEARIR
jgi:hypothetical protein